MDSEKRYIVGTLVENKPGVLFEVANMFRRRNFNIDSISVGPVESADVARMTISVSGDENTIEQIVKQLHKIIAVIKVAIFDAENTVARELALIKVHIADAKARADIIQYINIFRGHIIDISQNSLIVEMTGDTAKIDAFIELLRPFGIKEMARTGITALSRGGKAIKE